MGIAMLCEMLGCLPSELRENHPNMTVTDKMFMLKYMMRKYNFMSSGMGFTSKAGTISKPNR
jgi:predicted Rossmann-fold nucleotide-binding protein